MMVNNNVSLSYRLSRLMEDLCKDLAKYRKRADRNDYILREKERMIAELSAIRAEIEGIEPIGLFREISRILRRNILLEADITALLLPCRENLPPYPYARVVMADLTGCGIPDATALWEMHRDGFACVEVDDLTGRNISDVLALWANRGDLHEDETRRKEGLRDLRDDNV